MNKKIIKDVSFVGLGTGVQNRVLESVATLRELQDFRDLCLKAKDLSKQLVGVGWDKSKLIRSKICNISAKKSYYRKT